MSFFELEKHQTTVRQELTAGIVSFVTASYILVVNPLILAEAGVPPEWSVFSTILVTVLGCLLAAFWANAPLVIAPGMGENTFFAYTMVLAIGLTWQESLAATALSGVIFMLFSFTGLIARFAEMIPNTLKKAITVGIGLFLVLIGLKNSGLVMESEPSGTLALGDLSSPMTLLALFSLFLTAALFLRKVKGSFLIGIFSMTILSFVTGLHTPSAASFSLNRLGDFSQLAGAWDFSRVFELKFLLTVVSLTMLLIFETIGMAEGLLEDRKKSKAIYKAVSLTAAVSGFAGTSPVVPLAESASGIKEGGRTGLTALTAGVLFLGSFLLTPILAFIPQEAMGPVLVITGAAMMENLKEIPFDDFGEWFPAFLIICLMPFTGSVVNGMAFGFIAYVFLKLVNGERAKLNWPLVIVACLFALTLFSISFF